MWSCLCVLVHEHILMTHSAHYFILFYSGLSDQNSFQCLHTNQHFTYFQCFLVNWQFNCFHLLFFYWQFYCFNLLLFNWEWIYYTSTAMSIASGPYISIAYSAYASTIFSAHFMLNPQWWSCNHIELTVFDGLMWSDFKQKYLSEFIVCQCNLFCNASQCECTVWRGQLWTAGSCVALCFR